MTTDETGNGGKAGEEPPPSSAFARREKAASDALRALVRDLYTDRFGVPRPGGEMPLTLSVSVDPTAGWALTFVPPAQEQILPQLEDIQASRDVFQPGRVYCFRCDSAQCGHARPPNALAVFARYDSSGVPQWLELAQVLVEGKDERVDSLFAKRPRAVSLFQTGTLLRKEQLTSFGRASKTYALLGQVAAGYFHLTPGLCAGTEDGRLALTFQAVEFRTGNGRVRLRLNTVCRPPAGRALQDLFAEGWAPWLKRVIERAERALHNIERRAEAARAQGDAAGVRTVMKEIPRLLGRLSASLERGDRQTRRRTHHAEQRRQQRRPVRDAVADLADAGPESVFCDERNETVVVCAGGKRAHVFNREGRHVTSFGIRPDAVALRVQRHRWKPMPAEDVAAFKQRAQTRE
ncbi:MAG: hypothetical protein JXR37_15705 [Kiritimatiellae bacterium]|nr:hypothetical protein [Kiritimatiellia bacterium]